MSSSDGVTDPAADPEAVARRVRETLGLAPADVVELLDRLRERLADEVAVVAREQDDGGAVPVIAFADVEAGTVPPDDLAAIRRRGCVVVRATFPRELAEAWDRELGDYLARNRFDERWADLHPELAATGSRIGGVYWSRPQVLARQHPRMGVVRRFLNGFWRHESGGATWLDPARDIGYPDRFRRREPGATSQGLRPHVDSTADGGWSIPENRRVFAAVFAGRLDDFDPWDAAHRTAHDPASPSPSAVFRTFQGWTALSEIHPDDGGLHVVPIPTAIAYVMVRDLARDLGLLPEPDEPLDDWSSMGGRPGVADQLLLPALVPIPAVEPGDTVWWHGDLVHSVADAANDVRWSNVMYIGVAPGCERNDRYAPTMFERFARGASPIDFPAEDVEVDFVGRATPSDLDAVGWRQFGLGSEPVPSS